MKSFTPTVMVLWHANPFPFEPPIIYDGQWTGVLEPYIDNVKNSPRSSYFSIPVDEFDLLEHIEKNKIPKPDFLFICLDATMPYIARNINNVCSNNFLCLGDTHHLPQPISRMLSYVSLEKFNGLIFTNNVRHAHWFREVCDSEQFFEPGIFALNLGENHHENIKTSRQSTPIFYGQIGEYHPRRKRIMPNLLTNNLVRHIHGTQETLADELQKSIACINVTLNSDLNSRVFEIAQTGCLQILDELSIHNGHGSVLIPGHNCLTFKTEDDLVALLKDTSYICEFGNVIGSNLRNEYYSYWGMECIRKRLFSSKPLNSIKLNPVISTRKKLKTNISVNSRLYIYENLLELHRCHESIYLFIDGPEVDIFANDALDLPRIKVLSNADLLTPLQDLKILIKNSAELKPEICRII